MRKIEKKWFQMKINVVPSPSGRNVLNPKINLLYPRKRFLTRSITPGVLMLKKGKTFRNVKKKNQVLRDMREDSIGKIGIFVEDFGVSMSTLNIKVFPIVDISQIYRKKIKIKYLL